MILEALAEYFHASDPADALTLVEIIDQLGLEDTENTRRKMRGLIKREIRAGSVEAVQVTRPGIDGRHAKVPAYRRIK